MKQEVKAIINGIEITRTVGTKFPYYITLREGKGWKEFHTFKTCKEAKQFAVTITK